MTDTRIPITATHPAIAAQVAGFLEARRARHGTTRMAQDDPPAADPPAEDPPAEDPPAADPPADPTAEQAALDKLAGMTPEQLQAEVRRLRTENATRRVAANTDPETVKAATAAATAALVAKMGEALGITKAEANKLTPEQLTAQLGEARTALADRDKRDDLRNAAETGGARVAALLDRASVLAKLKTLDRDAPTYSADVAKLVTATIEADPSLKVTAPRVGGAPTGQFTGGTGDQDARPKSIREAATAAYGNA